MAEELSSDITRIWLSIGANLGDRAGTIERALQEIEKLPGTSFRCVSSLYATEPVGEVEQPEFLNCAAGYDTLLPPDYLLEELRSIERKLGRQHRERWHEREIDIDILLYGNRILNKENLTIPHPEMEHRGFVLIPLDEIASDVEHPILRKNIREILAALRNDQGVRKLVHSLFPFPGNHAQT